MRVGKKTRVCVIGAGPSGMAVLVQLNRLVKEQDVQVVCFEKASDWGGMWNFDWRTGTDKHGEPVHNSMYRHQWSNGPKECLELPDYSFEQHFGKAIPSYPPRIVLIDYLKGRWKSEGDLKKLIRFNTAVRHVNYDEVSKTFEVQTEELGKGEVLLKETFDYVLVASGHFSVPHLPDFPGLETFPGRVSHSHDFRDASEFVGKKILVIGGGSSAEDIATQCVKFGATSVIISYKGKPKGYDWPNSITERPLLKQAEGNTCTFIDGSSAEVDAIIMCTGYLHSYPFLEDSLRLRTKNVMYPRNLYKGVLWMGSQGNGEHCADKKLLYIGKHPLNYTFTLFEVEAYWAVNYIFGNIKLPKRNVMIKNWKQWVEREACIPTTFPDRIRFQSDHIQDLSTDSGYGHDLDRTAMFLEWNDHKQANNHGILTFRDKNFTSIPTGTESPSCKIPFMDAFDDSLEAFVNVDYEDVIEYKVIH